MSNLKLNNSLSNRLNKNKIKLYALAMAGVMMVSLTACNSNKTTKNETKPSATIVMDDEKLLQQIKSSVETNFDKIEVTKDSENNCYIIIEDNYMEIPLYNTDDEGQLVICGKQNKFLGTVEYNISFKDASSLGITELLEEKINIKTK